MTAMLIYMGCVSLRSNPSPSFPTPNLVNVWSSHFSFSMIISAHLRLPAFFCCTHTHTAAYTHTLTHTQTHTHKYLVVRHKTALAVTVNPMKEQHASFSVLFSEQRTEGMWSRTALQASIPKYCCFSSVVSSWCLITLHSCQYFCQETNHGVPLLSQGWLQHYVVSFGNKATKQGLE